MKGDKWNCVYMSGGGTEYPEGSFEEVSRTSKILTLRLLEEGFYCMYPEKIIRKIPIGDGKGTAFCPAVTEWDDDEITVYHNAAGTPYIYSRERTK